MIIALVDNVTDILCWMGESTNPVGAAIRLNKWLGEKYHYTLVQTIERTDTAYRAYEIPRHVYGKIANSNPLGHGIVNYVKAGNFLGFVLIEDSRCKF